LRQVLVAAGPIRAGETFASGKISLETRDIAASDEAPLDPSSPLQGMIASRFVPAGRMLTVSSFQSPPLIKSGDHVMIEYSKGSLDLKADGIAKENGYEGKQIRVMNIDTKRIVNAVAIDSTTVAIGEKEGM
jgi:flagella basal body P-ring formation protein FlgA